MNLIIVTDSDMVDDNTCHLGDHRAEHIRSVLKLERGDPVEIGRLNGPQGKARIGEITSDRVVLVVEEWSEVAPPHPAIDLICALPRPQTLKKILLTSAMMGVRSLHLVRANRVEKSYFQSPLVAPEKQRPYLLEGLSQGKLTRLPVVEVHDRFRPFFEDRLDRLVNGNDKAGTRLLCDPDTDKTLDSALGKGPGPLTIAIGPEGGWVPFETELMRSIGFRPFTLGRWILRVEHAVTAVLSQLELLRMMRE